MNIIIFSHSYLDPENRKNLLALSRLANVTCVLPKHAPVLIFNDYEFHPDGNDSDIFFPLKFLRLSKSQYLLRGLSEIFRSRQPDAIIVEYNPWSAMFIQTLILRFLFCQKAKLICMVKKNTYSKVGLHGYIKDQLARFTLSRADHILAASNMASDMLKGVFKIPSEKLSVCHHLGVDTNLFCPSHDMVTISGRAINIGYSGRFDAGKGIIDLFEAVQILQENKSRQINLKLLGQGAYSKKLDEKLEKLSCDHSWFSLHPPVAHTEVARFLQDLDIFVLPSRRMPDHQEHDAHALLEALSVGVVCVGTYSGIIPDILKNGVGRLVRPERPKELAGVLCELIENDGVRVTVGRNARDFARRTLELDVIAERKIEVIGKIIDNEFK